MLSATLSSAEAAKFRLLARGITLGEAATNRLHERNPGNQLTPADYASTSGIILVLGDDVWVNAPVVDHNPNFVTDPTDRLEVVDDSLRVITADGDELPARWWFPPAFHELCNEHGEPYTSYGFTHTDRVRISPVEGCAMTCKFCDLPYEFRYRTKQIDGLLDTARRALEDPVQPGHHVLISGGTPREADYGYVLDCYEQVLTGLDGTPVDIMMVPLPEVLPIERLGRLGVDELSINLELFGRDRARALMRRKFDQGRDHYLEFLGAAAEILGPDRVRSMLMVGLEPIEDTLAGVRAIAERGCVPVLSPFRPDPLTPMRDEPPATEALLAEVYLRAREITAEHGVRLGPRCVPCSHNTLTLAATGVGDADHAYGNPKLIS